VYRCAYRFRLETRRCTAPNRYRHRDQHAVLEVSEYHQQYLHKNPGGYCGIGGTGVSCPVGLGA